MSVLPINIQDSTQAQRIEPVEILSVEISRVDPLDQFETQLNTIREEQRQARAEQRVLDRQRAEEYCNENPEKCKPLSSYSETPSEDCRWVLSSWYGSLPGDGYVDGYHGRTAANGRTFNTHAYTVAHKTLPFGTVLQVKNMSGGFFSVVVTDRGPYSGGRVLDFSRAGALAAKTIDGDSLYSDGVGQVYVCF